MSEIENKVENNYGGEQIEVLEGLEPVRKRPGMYIGSTGPSGLHHLVYEIVDNSIDEALAGYCDHIEVEILPGNIIRVTDNGRGIPVGIQPKLGIPAVTVVFTVLHAGGKFGGENSGYKVSGGLHGVGASVVNAMSEWLKVTVSTDSGEYTQTYARGVITSDLVRTGDAKRRGTQVEFKADDEMFETTVYDYKTLEKRMREQAQRRPENNPHGFKRPGKHNIRVNALRGRHKRVCRIRKQSGQRFDRFAPGNLFQDGG